MLVSALHLMPALPSPSTHISTSAAAVETGPVSELPVFLGCEIPYSLYGLTLNTGDICCVELSGKKKISKLRVFMHIKETCHLDVTEEHKR